MRHIVSPVISPMICISIAVLAAGCGHVNALPTAATQGVVAAQSATVETGAIAFDKSVSYKAVDILGIGAVQAAKLQGLGINTVAQLLEAGGSRTGRAHLAKQTGISEKLILTWVNHCDLMRVMGCGPEYARLLELAGVDTVPDLASRNAVNLAAKLPTANNLGAGHVCVHRLPNLASAQAWVSNARNFERVVKY